MPELTLHPLPALPAESQTRIDSWNDPKSQLCQSERETGRRGIMRESEDYLALFDDTSEVHVEALLDLDDNFLHFKIDQHEATPLGDSEGSPPTPRHHLSDDTILNDTLSIHHQKSKPPDRSAAHLSQRQQGYDFCIRNNDIGVEPAIFLNRASLEAVIDYAATATPESPFRRDSSDAGHYFLPDDDYEPHRTPYVRFADAHTYLCTPSPPTPPPHGILSIFPSASTPSLLPLKLSYTSSTSELNRIGPYGPRIPPWGSSENLDRERRLRTDLRVLEDRLEERFNSDARRRARERQREYEEVKSGVRRTEGEELRKAVLGIYPEMEDETKEWMCCYCDVSYEFLHQL